MFFPQLKKRTHFSREFKRRLKFPVHPFFSSAPFLLAMLMVGYLFGSEVKTWYKRWRNYEMSVCYRLCVENNNWLLFWTICSTWVHLTSAFNSEISFSWRASFILSFSISASNRVNLVSNSCNEKKYDTFYLRNRRIACIYTIYEGL